VRGAADEAGEFPEVVGELQGLHLGPRGHDLLDRRVLEANHGLDHVALGLAELALVPALVHHAEELGLDRLGPGLVLLPGQALHHLVEESRHAADGGLEHVERAEDRGPHVDHGLGRVVGDAVGQEQPEDPDEDRGAGGADSGVRGGGRRGGSGAQRGGPVDQADHDEEVADDAGEADGGGVPVGVLEDAGDMAGGAGVAARRGDLLEGGAGEVAQALEEGGEQPAQDERRGGDPEPGGDDHRGSLRGSSCGR
jgi:hypothetical protein